MEKVVVLNHPLHEQRTLGQRAADSLSKHAGSWTFIICILLFLGFWILVNIYAWVERWDPYPFILLNLILSSIATLQAPIILMSQNRQSQKDRIKAEYDYKLNRKSEKEVEEILVRLGRIERKLRKR